MLPTRRETFRYLTNSHLEGFLVEVPKKIPPLELELGRKDSILLNQSCTLLVASNTSQCDFMKVSFRKFSESD